MNTVARGLSTSRHFLWVGTAEEKQEAPKRANNETDQTPESVFLKGSNNVIIILSHYSNTIIFIFIYNI